MMIVTVTGVEYTWSSS